MGDVSKPLLLDETGRAIVDAIDDLQASILDGHLALKGADGESAGFGIVTANIENDGGEASVDVEASGPDSAKNFEFTFRNIKGETDFTFGETLVEKDKTVDIKTPVQGVYSQSEYDELTPEQQKTGLYFISSDDGDEEVGVVQFNGRVGYVKPMAKDYDAFYAYPLYAYDGVNIAEKFAGEMNNTDPWTWVQQRLANKDISGLHIKDYFEVEADGNLIQMQIGDINHDLGFMDEEITTYHIDFISKDLWHEHHQWNKAIYNNGLESEPNPWLCSDLKAWLNSEKANVPNAGNVNPSTVAVDYATTGVLNKLQKSLQDVIVERYSLEPTRYSKDGLLTDDTAWAWKNIGKLWTPNETEVFGQIVWGTRSGYSVGTTHQFPIFMDGKTRVKHLGVEGERRAWWTRSTCSGTTQRAACVTVNSLANGTTSSYPGIGVPVCFRISA